MLAPPGYRIYQGETVGLAVASSAAAVVEANFRVMYDDGSLDLFNVSRFTSGSARAIELFGADHVAKKAGTVISGALNPFTSLKRGQFYYQMLVGKSVGETAGRLTRQSMGQGYLYDLSPAVLGWFVESGPAGGQGNVAWVTVADDIAPADITHLLAATNAYRRIYGFIWYYTADSNTATRTIRALMRSVGLGVPTGWTLDQNVNFPHQGDLTLTANQDGIVYAYNSQSGGPDYWVRNDAGSFTVEDHTTAGGIFPLEVEEDDLAAIFFSVTGELAGDRHSLYVLQEEWIMV